MADTLQAKNSSGVKNLRDRLTAWDAKTDAKAPLTDRQKDGFIELTTLSANRPLPLEVAIHCLLLSCSRRGRLLVIGKHGVRFRSAIWFRLAI